MKTHRPYNGPLTRSYIWLFRLYLDRVLKLFEIPFLPFGFGTELRNMIPSHTKHYDGTVKKLSGTFRLTHTVNNSLYGEFIMYSCSTVLKNNYSAKYATSTMSTFCAKTTYILLCLFFFVFRLFHLDCLLQFALNSNVLLMLSKWCWNYETCETNGDRQACFSSCRCI